MNAPNETSTTTVEGPAFTATLAGLQTALSALNVVPARTRPATPVLGGVLVEAVDGDVTLSVFDYECSARVRLSGAQIKEDGQILLDRADVIRILKAAIRGETKKTLTTWEVAFTGRTATSVTSATKDAPGQTCATGSAEIAAGGFEMPVACLPRGDFPLLPAPDNPNLAVDRDQLATMLARVAVAAGTDATFPVLTGVWLEPSDGALTLVCTNRFQLTVGRIDADVLVKCEAPGYLLPAAELVRAVKSLPAGPVAIGLVKHPQHALATVTAGDVQITFRLLDAEFPRYRQLLPARAVGTVEVNRAAFSKAVDKATALAGRFGVIDLDVRGGHLTVTPRLDDPELQGKARGVPVDSAVCGVDDIVIGFTGSWLLSALGSIPGSRVALNLIAPDKPALLAADVADLGNDSAAFRHLLMPYKQPS